VYHQVISADMEYLKMEDVNQKKEKKTNHLPEELKKIIQLDHVHLQKNMLKVNVYLNKNIFYYKILKIRIEEFIYF